MYAVVKTKRAPGAETTTVSIPKIERNEVLVKVKTASICGTDVHIWNWNKWAQERIKKVPFIFGHELCGEVVEVGVDVSSVKSGDFVSAETHIVDGTCYQCRTDRMHVCRHVQILGVDRDGVFAEYVALPERNAWKNDPKLDSGVASVQEPLGNAVQTALPKDNVEDIVGKNVAVLGCGPIGLMAVAVLKALGAAKIFATAGGLNRVRMDLATKMGADLVLSAREEGENISQIILDETDGKGVDVVLEMSGAPSALRQAFEILTPGGRVSLLGLFDSSVMFDFNNTMIFKAATVYGISGRRMFQTWYQVKGLLSDSVFRSKIASIITHKLSMEDVEEGVELINSKKAAKVVLEPKW
ncbi:MAG: L-threonine 3-dehydrogenase [Candidatus Bathyarchaeota archaeon]|nr:L-threonine 3-dehydrogenase [Candidatus Bathyarchaeota archaeon]MDH5495577.1 L-threonine 3-dehydrogenase [Candidatus Bathyarchaeota archaeon]